MFFILEPSRNLRVSSFMMFIGLIPRVCIRDYLPSHAIGVENFLKSPASSTGFALAFQLF